MHLLELDLHVLAHLQVQGREGLVEEQHLGLIHYRAGDGHPLLLSAGKGFHIPVLIVGHTHHPEHLAHLAGDLLLRDLLEF